MIAKKNIIICVIFKLEGRKIVVDFTRFNGCWGADQKQKWIIPLNGNLHSLTAHDSFSVKDLNVCDYLMTNEIGPISPGLKFVYAKVEQAGRSPETNLF